MVTLAMARRWGRFDTFKIGLVEWSSRKELGNVFIPRDGLGWRLALREAGAIAEWDVRRESSVLLYKEKRPRISKGLACAHAFV